MSTTILACGSLSLLLEVIRLFLPKLGSYALLWFPKFINGHTHPGSVHMFIAMVTLVVPPVPREASICLDK